MNAIPIHAEDLELIGALRPYVGPAGQHFLSTLIELVQAQREKTQAQVVDALAMKESLRQLMEEEASKAYSLFLVSVLLNLTERSISLPSAPSPPVGSGEGSSR